MHRPTFLDSALLSEGSAEKGATTPKGHLAVWGAGRCTGTAGTLTKSGGKRWECSELQESHRDGSLCSPEKHQADQTKRLNSHYTTSKRESCLGKKKVISSFPLIKQATGGLVFAANKTWRNQGTPHLGCCRSHRCPMSPSQTLKKKGKFIVTWWKINKWNKGHEIIKTFLSIHKVDKNSLGVESPVHGVYTGREWECGQPIYFLFIVFWLWIEKEKKNITQWNAENLQSSHFYPHLLLRIAAVSNTHRREQILLRIEIAICKKAGTLN